MKHGRVIILNGASSSGKTSIVRALQAIWPSPLLHVGLDTMIAMLPFHYTAEGKRAETGYQLIAGVEDGEPLADYRIGHHGRLLNRQLVRLAADLSRDGFDIAIDHVITDEVTMTELLDTLAAAPTILVGVTSKPEVLAARERTRGDRMPGLARGQARAIYACSHRYDLIVDTTRDDSASLAQRIADQFTRIALYSSP